MIDSGTPIELSALRKSGTEITIELSLNPLTGLSGAGRFVLAIVRDVSERKRAETVRLELVRREAGREWLALPADAGGLLGATCLPTGVHQ